MQSIQTAPGPRNVAPFGLGLVFSASLAACATAPASASTPSPTDTTARPVEADDDATADPSGGPWHEEISRAFERADEFGTAVVFDAHTGTLLSSVEYFGEVGHDARHQRAFAPASSVKPLLVMAALEAGVIDPDYETTCTGALEVDGQALTCYAEHGHLDITDGLATSCNAFAYDVARRLGPDRIEAAFSGYGFGSSTGAFDDEAVGTILGDGDDLPSSPGVAAALVGTGHGPLRVTAVQLGRAYLRLLSREDSPARRAVMSGLRAAVEAEGGTASAARLDDLVVGAKTGTADHVDAQGREAKGSYDTWLVAVAPLEDPEIVLVVHTLDTRVAPQSAAVVGGQILRDWQSRRGPT